MAKSTPSRKPPELKVTPVNSGLSVAIWLNSVETDEGVRQFRTVTISPRRYRDRTTGEWKDGTSYAPSDLPALIFALEKAKEYCYTAPLPGQKEEPAAEAPVRQPGDEEVPY